MGGGSVAMAARPQSSIGGAGRGTSRVAPQRQTSDVSRVSHISSTPIRLSAAATDT